MKLKNKNDSPVTLRIIFNLITPFDLGYITIEILIPILK